MAVTIDQEQKRANESENKLSTVEDKLTTAQSALEKEQMNKDEVSSKVKNLEAEKSMNEKYAEAMKKFSSDEAEVYRQGDNLLIRLKGMEFPTAGATIESKSYPLLGKVKEVLKEFGSDSAVVIEGHTDSVGGKALNNKLSANRANAVKNYLEANSEIEGLKIEAKGFGDKKPLASNKTTSGRAQNRRVDIVIKPEATKL